MSQLITKNKKQIRISHRVFADNQIEWASILNSTKLLEELRKTPMGVYLPDNNVAGASTYCLSAFNTKLNDHFRTALKEVEDRKKDILFNVRTSLAEELENENFFVNVRNPQANLN